MIGYVSIVSSDSNISFNSDRTQFAQNRLTDDIINSVKEMNKRIQTTGSTIKNELNGRAKLLKRETIDSSDIADGFDGISLVNQNILLKDSITWNINNGKIEYNLFAQKLSVEILEKQKEKKIKSYKFYLGKVDKDFQSEIIKSPSNTSRIILYKEVETDKIDLSKSGQWVIKDEMEDKIIITKINMIEPDPPQITVKIDEVELHQPYKYDDLFTVINSFGEIDKGVELDITCDELNVNNQKNKGLITFDSIKEVKLEAALRDKKTNLKHNFDAYFRVMDSSKRIKTTVDDEAYIKMPVSDGSNLPPSIQAFVTELNRLAINDDYSYTFVSSVRTLVELLVIDIMNRREISKNDNLSNNYELVVKDYGNFSELITDQKDKQIITGLVRSIGSKDERESFLAFLNLSTHGSSRIISKSQVINKTRELMILLEYLNILCSK